MPTTAARRIAQAALLAALSVGSLAACGDDNDAADTEDAAETVESSTTTTAESTTTTPADDLDAFCAAATDLVGVTPTSEQLAEYAELAPDEIAAPVETFVAAFEEAAGDLGVVFSDPDVSAATDEIAAFEAEECGITQPGPPPGVPTPGGAEG